MSIDRKRMGTFLEAAWPSLPWTAFVYLSYDLRRHRQLFCRYRRCGITEHIKKVSA